MSVHSSLSSVLPVGPDDKFDHDDSIISQARTPTRTPSQHPRTPTRCASHTFLQERHAFGGTILNDLVDTCTLENKELGINAWLEYLAKNLEDGNAEMDGSCLPIQTLQESERHEVLAREEMRKIIARIWGEDHEALRVCQQHPFPLHIDLRAVGAYIECLQQRCQQHSQVEACLRQRLLLFDAYSYQSKDTVEMSRGNGSRRGFCEDSKKSIEDSEDGERSCDAAGQEQIQATAVWEQEKRLQLRQVTRGSPLVELVGGVGQATKHAASRPVIARATPETKWRLVHDPHLLQMELRKTAWELEQQLHSLSSHSADAERRAERAEQHAQQLEQELGKTAELLEREADARRALRRQLEVQSAQVQQQQIAHERSLLVCGAAFARCSSRRCLHAHLCSCSSGWQWL
jgi:hypothetical protein